MDTVEIIAVSIVGGIIGLFVIAGLSVVCLKYRANAAAEVVTAATADVEAPDPKPKMPVVISCEDLTYIRCA
jgi:hypothetical protein